MIRLGKWEDVLADVTCDALIVDPPYGAKVHDVEIERRDASNAAGSTPSYASWSPDDVQRFVASWSPRTRGWMVAMTSHDLIPAWQAAYEAAGRYAFAPVVALINGMTVRLGGDGPSSWAIYVMVARPRTAPWSTWGALPGGYYGTRQDGAGGGRGKPAWLVNALVRDYSKHGDLVCDPCAGWGTTIAAAIGNGRRAVGAEMDVDAHREAKRRLALGVTIDLFGAA